MKKDYLQIFQLRFKSKATWLKLGHSGVFQQDNNAEHKSNWFWINEAG